MKLARNVSMSRRAQTMSFSSPVLFRPRTWPCYSHNCNQRKLVLHGNTWVFMELDSKRGRDDQWVGVHLVNKLEWEGHIKVQYIRSN